MWIIQTSLNENDQHCAGLELNSSQSRLYPCSTKTRDILSSSNFLQGVDQQILPCGQGRIDSVKINPSLLMMREWLVMLTHPSFNLMIANLSCDPIPANMFFFSQCKIFTDKCKD